MVLTSIERFIFSLNILIFIKVMKILNYPYPHEAGLTAVATKFFALVVYGLLRIDILVSLH
ncbi:hypothetical protein BHOIPH601_11820 [Bartonella henselae]